MKAWDTTLPGSPAARRCRLGNWTYLTSWACWSARNISAPPSTIPGGIPRETKPVPPNRWDNSIAGVIRRDRNHPSVIIWSLLNEVSDGPLFRHVVASLPRLRGLDPSRLILLNSGRFDKDETIGSWSSPGSKVWEKAELNDVHSYPTFPHSAEAIRRMRGLEARPAPETILRKPSASRFSSQNTACAARQDFIRYLRHFEQLGKEQAPDAIVYRQLLDRFLADWKKYRLDECWARPEDYFRDSQPSRLSWPSMT